MPTRGPRMARGTAAIARGRHRSAPEIATAKHAKHANPGLPPGACQSEPDFFLRHLRILRFRYPRPPPPNRHDDGHRQYVIPSAAWYKALAWCIVREYRVLDTGEECQRRTIPGRVR